MQCSHQPCHSCYSGTENILRGLGPYLHLWFLNLPQLEQAFEKEENVSQEKEIGQGVERGRKPTAREEEHIPGRERDLGSIKRMWDPHLLESHELSVVKD